MITSISLIILISSLIGIGVMAFRKIPQLSQLPQTETPKFSFWSVFSKTRKIIRIPFPAKRVPSEVFLQKVLSRVRVFTLKTDHKTSGWLQKLRENSQKKKFGENDNYWKKLRKTTKE